MKTVLLIEDHADNRETTVELLELHGYRVIEAGNGSDGIALARQVLPDLILCDITIPEPNGYEVFNELAGDERTCRIPFVFLSAVTEPGSVNRGLDLGVRGYIRKPFDASELFDTIEHCLAGRDK